ncbi:hypothetical protein J6590_068974 [Homalodisca vitripennis]|nr:hypothetical protein J6590_068974 [Homalodisca vitripennis]
MACWRHIHITTRATSALPSGTLCIICPRSPTTPSSSYCLLQRYIQRRYTTEVLVYNSQHYISSTKWPVGVTSYFNTSYISPNISCTLHNLPTLRQYFFSS